MVEVNNVPVAAFRLTNRRRAHFVIFAIAFAISPYSAGGEPGSFKCSLRCESLKANSYVKDAEGLSTAFDPKGVEKTNKRFRNELWLRTAVGLNTRGVGFLT